MKRHEKELHNDPWDRDFYETGSTKPPKNHGGFIAVLLVMVIILGGITTALGILNIRLFKMLTNLQEEQTQADFQIVQWENSVPPSVEVTVSTEPPQSVEVPVRLGLECVTVSEFDQRFYQLPEGCLIMDVLEGSPAEQSDLRAGDVIVSMNGQAVESVEELQKLLYHCSAGEEVSLEIYRSHISARITVPVTLEEP